MTYTPKYISDKPKGIDKFNGGSQNSLAHAIEQHMLRNDSDKNDSIPRIIGIEGTWGSGKSNVVKIVKKQLESSSPKGYHFFEYDAWGNQEDLQRRSLLEQLTADLISNEILKGKTTIKIKGGGTKHVSWDEKLKLLLARKSETTSESYPRISNGMIAGALTTALTSISSLLALLLADKCGWWSIIIAFIPIIVTFIIWAIAAYNNKNYRSLSYLLAIYSEKINKETEFEVISEDEPSVVEFKEWMKDVSDKLNHDVCRKLVIVFDNMDRLPAEKVKQLWSSIHTFFAETGFDNIWAIIPFDESHLSCAFGEEPGDQLKLTRYFINKTFPVTFSVPKPVITDYKGIFKTLFSESFGNNVKEEEIINRIYRLQNTDPNVRDIIIFINNLVSLYFIWGDEIQLTTMAIFTLHKDAILKNPVNAILSGDYLGAEKSIINNDNGFKSEMAALTYGVKKETAKQIPLSEYISKCIDNSEQNDINTFAESNSDFDDILKEVITTTDTAKNEQIIKCLDKLKHSNDVIVSLWEELALRLLKDEIGGQTLPESYKITIKHVCQNTCQQLVDKLCMAWRDCQNFSGSDYVRCINSLDMTQGPGFNIPRPEKAVSAEVYIDALATALDSYKLYNLTADFDKVDEYLANKLPNEFKYAHIVEILIKNEAFSFARLKEKIEELIDNNAIDISNVWQICKTYRTICRDEVVTKLINESNLETLLPELKNNQKTALEDGYIDLLAISLARHRSIVIEDKYVPEVAEIIDAYINHDDLMLNNLSWNNVSINKLIKYMIENKLGDKISVEKILKKFEEVKNHYSISADQLLNHLNEWDSSSLENSPEYEGLQFIELIPSSSTITATSTHPSELAKRINTLAVKALSEQTAQHFIDIERSYSSDYWHQILEALLNNEAMVEKPKCVVDYAAHIWYQLATGAKQIHKGDHFYNIATSINPSKISHVFIDVRDAYCNNTVTIDSTRFKFIEENLRKYGVLEYRAPEVVNRIIKPVISTEGVKKLIVENSSFYQELFVKAGDIEDFRNTAKQAWGEDKSFMATLGITSDK